MIDNRHLQIHFSGLYTSMKYLSVIGWLFFLNNVIGVSNILSVQFEILVINFCLYIHNHFLHHNTETCASTHVTLESPLRALRAHVKLKNSLKYYTLYKSVESFNVTSLIGLSGIKVID